jgi:hypothetical protein
MAGFLRPGGQMHDLILVVCTLLLFVAIMGGCTRIASAIGGFSITITPLRDTKKSDGNVTEAEQHG